MTCCGLSSPTFELCRCKQFDLLLHAVCFTGVMYLSPVHPAWRKSFHDTLQLQRSRYVPNAVQVHIRLTSPAFQNAALAELLETMWIRELTPVCSYSDQVGFEVDFSHRRAQWERVTERAPYCDGLFVQVLGVQLCSWLKAVMKIRQPRGILLRTSCWQWQPNFDTCLCMPLFSCTSHMMCGTTCATLAHALLT